MERKQVDRRPIFLLTLVSWGGKCFVVNKKTNSAVCSILCHLISFHWSSNNERGVMNEASSIPWCSYLGQMKTTVFPWHGRHESGLFHLYYTHPSNSFTKVYTAVVYICFSQRCYRGRFSRITRTRNNICFVLINLQIRKPSHLCQESKMIELIWCRNNGFVFHLHRNCVPVLRRLMPKKFPLLKRSVTKAGRAVLGPRVLKPPSHPQQNRKKHRAWMHHWHSSIHRLQLHFSAGCLSLIT